MRLWQVHSLGKDKMKQIKSVVALVAVALLALGCNGNQKSQSNDNKVGMEEVVNQTPDSTLYGVCGKGTAMHTLELVTDAGDTLNFEIADGDEPTVKGGLLEGDRLAVISGKGEDGTRIANNVINLTTLLGKWTSIDKNFEIQEGGVVKSSIKAETNPWTSWKILNGKLLLNKDTFAINELGADSLYLENANGIFTYKRLK